MRPTCFSPSGVNHELSVDELAGILRFWYDLTSVCGKTKQKWEGPDHWFTFRVHQQQLEHIYESIGVKEYTTCVEAMKALNWVGEDTTIDVSTEMKDPLWKELRDMGLFEGNPQKNWGPKKMK